MNARYNAVIVGQTGVGKSTLINYLYGKKVAEAGVGKPVTKNGFHPIDFEINGLPVCLFDSWGLEVGKHEEWLQDLDNEFKQRGVNEPADKWFHSVFYCINAGSARIQECDITIIKKFIAENYKVSVILTKADQISEDVEDILRKEIQSQINGISVIGVCSEGKTRAGISQTFGKKDIERQAFDDFFDSLILRLTLRCKNVMEQAFENWVEKTIAKAKTTESNEFDIDNEITNTAEELQNRMTELVNNEIKKTLEMYGFFNTHLGYLPPAEINSSKEEVETKEMVDSGVNIFSSYQKAYITVMWTFSPKFRSRLRNTFLDCIDVIIKCYRFEFSVIIRKYVEDVTDMLETAKLKVTEQK